MTLPPGSCIRSEIPDPPPISAMTTHDTSAIPVGEGSGGGGGSETRHIPDLLPKIFALLDQAAQPAARRATGSDPLVALARGLRASQAEGGRGLRTRRPTRDDPRR